MPQTGRVAGLHLESAVHVQAQGLRGDELAGVQAHELAPHGPQGAGLVLLKDVHRLATRYRELIGYANVEVAAWFAGGMGSRRQNLADRVEGAIPVDRQVAHRQHSGAVDEARGLGEAAHHEDGPLAVDGEVPAGVETHRRPERIGGVVGRVGPVHSGQRRVHEALELGHAARISQQVGAAPEQHGHVLEPGRIGGQPPKRLDAVGAGIRRGAVTAQVQLRGHPRLLHYQIVFSQPRSRMRWSLLISGASNAMAVVAINRSAGSGCMSAASDASAIR